MARCGTVAEAAKGTRGVFQGKSMGYQGFFDVFGMFKV